MAKNKGANAEREVAKILQPVVDKVYASFDLESPAMKRNLEQTRGGGYDLVGVDWLALEIKRQEQLSVNTWWKQTLSQANEDQIPVLIYRQNKQKWKVIMMGGVKVAPRKWKMVRMEVALEPFLRWFELKLKEELSK
jgi:hypothetical protein